MAQTTATANNYYGNYTGTGNDGLSLSIREELRQIEKGRVKSVWHNPAKERTQINGKWVEPESLYIGEAAGMTPTWDEQVFDVAQYRKAAEQYGKGQIDEDRLQFSPYVGEWEDRANEFMSQINTRGAAVIKSDDFSALKVINIMAEVLGTKQREYVLEQAVTTINTPNILLSIDTWTGFDADQDVEEGVEALTHKGTQTRQDITMKKQVGAIAITDEARMVQNEDLFRRHVNHVVNSIKKIKATKIATELITAANDGSADWAATTGGISNVDPIADIADRAASPIELNNGIPDSIASSGKPFRNFFGNTHVKGTTTGAIQTSFGNKVIPNVPGLPGFTWYIDNLMPATTVVVYDKSAMLFLQGPVRTAEYRDEGKGIDQYVTRDWCTTKLIDSSRAKEITGVAL